MNKLCLLVVTLIILLSCHSSMGGKVVSKKHNSAYTMQMWQRGNENKIHVPSEYIISVDVNGNITDFAVSQFEYNSIQVGDYYQISK